MGKQKARKRALVICIWILLLVLGSAHTGHASARHAKPTPPPHPTVQVHIRHYLNGPSGWTRTTQYDQCCITASGLRVFYGEVAADPAIQFGAHMVIPGLGTFVVEDRGIVYGAHVDIYVPYYPYPGIPDWVKGVYWYKS